MFRVNAWSIDIFVSVFLQEFFDLWPVLMGEQAPYSGPVTPDGRVHFLKSLIELYYQHSAW